MMGLAYGLVPAVVLATLGFWLKDFDGCIAVLGWAAIALSLLFGWFGWSALTS